MTVIAGVSLFNGVMLAADCRVSILRPGRRTVIRDEAQKVFALTPTTIIGFSGDVATASALMQELIHQIKRGRRSDPVSIHQWLPRFFKASYAALKRKGRVGRVDFMVGSVIPGRTNVIERQKVVDLMQEIAFGNPGIQRSFIPDIVMQVMMTNPAQTLVAMPGTIAGVLCTQSSPAFRPKYLKPLEFAAIGSGQHATVQIKRTADWLLAGMPGNDFTESHALTSTLSQFIAENEIKDVGGMYPCLKVDQRGAGHLGAHHRFPFYEVSLTFDPTKYRWTQQNHTTGKKIELLYPREILKRSTLDDLTFNDMREAIEHANPLRARRVTK
jgi:Proteasome subunit